jgi:hypothetical protein
MIYYRSQEYRLTKARDLLAQQNNITRVTGIKLNQIKSAIAIKLL